MPTTADWSIWSDAGLPEPVVLALVAARVLGVAWPLTAWGTATLDVRARLLVALGGAILIAPLVARGTTTIDTQPAALALSALAELARGAALGLSAALVVAAARQAGELIGAAAGLTPMLDQGPSGSTAPDEPLTPTGALYLVLALGTFLVLDGPVAMTLALVESYRDAPLGGGGVVFRHAAPSDLAFAASHAIGKALGLVLRLAAPVALPLVVAQLVLGFVTRLAPTPPWSALAWPLRIVLAMGLVLLTLSVAVAILRLAWADIG